MRRFVLVLAVVANLSLTSLADAAEYTQYLSEDDNTYEECSSEENESSSFLSSSASASSISTSSTSSSSNSSSSSSSNSSSSSSSSSSSTSSSGTSNSCPQCPDDQELSECPDAFCGALTCAEAGYARPNCGNSSPCPGEPGCICKNGYLKDAYGNCIPPVQCPSCRGDSNAYPSICGSNCGKKCSDLPNVKNNVSSICPLICNLNGCDCRDNFYYDTNLKKCVLEDKCTSICPNLNEEYNKCPDCSPQTCATRNNTYHCPMIPANQSGSNCKPACRCKKGYFRNSQNVCVLANECDDCPENQVYSDCPSASCAPLTCAEAGFSKENCGSSSPCVGGQGCICISGYLKDSNGNCIESSKCPSCGGDDNAIPGCGNCGKNCGDIGLNGTIICPLYCPLNDCTCKPNYWYDNNSKKCVESNKCTPPCKENEEYSTCSNGLCRVQDCKDKGKTRPCPPMFPGSCISGCVCPLNYLRKNGVCVPEDQCEDNSQQQQPSNTNQNTCTDVESLEQSLEQGSNVFCMKFLKKLVAAKPSESCITSPASILTPMAELVVNAKDQTFTEIMTVLNLTTKEQVRCAFPAFLKTFQVTEGTELDLANRIYVADQYKLSDSFKSDSENVFNASAVNIDFNQADQAADTINEWVSDVTNGKINDLVSADMFDSLTRLVLTNAIYFKGTWKTEFNPNNTQSSDFHVDADTAIQVQMMHQKSKFKYANNNDLDAQIVEIPYQDENVSFVIILPNQQYGLLNVIDKLQDTRVYSNLLNSLTTQTVTLSFPKMDLSTSIDLIEILKQVGIETIFTSKAELSGMIVPDEPLYVSDAIQKATITVNEKGSEAAAANAVTVTALSAVIEPQEFIVTADHPFVYCIKLRNLLLFLGVFYG